jgi:hypothetical protein
MADEKPFTGVADRETDVVLPATMEARAGATAKLKSGARGF